MDLVGFHRRTVVRRMVTVRALDGSLQCRSRPMQRRLAEIVETNRAHTAARVSARRHRSPKGSAGRKGPTSVFDVSDLERKKYVPTDRVDPHRAKQPDDPRHRDGGRVRLHG